MPDPIDNLLALAELAQRDDPTLAAWFVPAVDTWLRGEGDLLDKLGLRNAPGERSVRSAWAAQQRLQRLRSAWQCLDPTLAPWIRAGQLAAAVSEFEQVFWPAWSELEQPPAGASKLRTALFAARRHGELPCSQRRLHDLLKDATETSAAAWFSRRLV